MKEKQKMPEFDFPKEEEKKEQSAQSAQSEQSQQSISKEEMEKIINEMYKEDHLDQYPKKN